VFKLPPTSAAAEPVSTSSAYSSHVRAATLAPARRHWTADNGLPQNAIRDIVQTRDRIDELMLKKDWE